MNTLTTGRRRQSFRYLTVFVVLAFSLNVFAVGSVFAAGDLLGCNSSHTWERYNELHEWIKNNASNTDSNSDMVYNLARVSLCLGKASEGIDHLQRASNSGHIPATYLLGLFYKYNQTFHSSEKANLENLNSAIHYYKKATQMIESTPNYPVGSTDDMPYIESTSYTSYTVFSKLPALYFNGYLKALNNITNGDNETFYDDTLDVLTNMRQTAMQCLERPALDAWKEKKEIVHQAQQIECNAMLSFAEAAYLFEQQRIEADQNCASSLENCTEYQKLVDNIYQLVDNTFNQILSAPRF